MKPVIAIAVLCALLGACSVRSTTVERPVAQPAPTAVVVPDSPAPGMTTVVRTPG